MLSYKVFDNSGRTITSYLTNSNRSILFGAGSLVYSTNSETSLTNNRLLTSSEVGVQAANYLSDCGIENTTSLGSTWVFSGGGTGSISTGTKRTGAKALGVTRSAFNADSVFSQTVTGLKVSTWYVISAYVNTSQVTTLGTGSVYLCGGSTSGTPINWNTGGIGDNWERVYAAVQTNSSGSITANAVASGVTGAVYFDDFQLELSLSGASGVPSSVNLLENGSMNKTSGWSFSYSQMATYAADSVFENTLLLVGDPDLLVNAHQTVNIDLPGTQTYVFSTWTKGTSVSGSSNNSSTYRIWAQVYYVGETGAEDHYIDCCTDTVNWQYAFVPIVPKCPQKTVERIDLFLKYENNANTASFTNVSLVREDATNYTYNSNGDLVSIATPESAAQTYSYSGADLISAVTQGSGTYSYTYDTKHRVTAVSNDGVTMALTYDSAGNATAGTLTATGSSQSMTTSSAYTNGNSLLASATDTREK